MIRYTLDARILKGHRPHIPKRYSEDSLFGLGLRLGLGVRVRIAYVRYSGPSE